jgi:hypothetical protein
MVFEIITFRLKCTFTTIKNHRGWEAVIADFINDLSSMTLMAMTTRKAAGVSP